MAQDHDAFFTRDSLADEFVTNNTRNIKDTQDYTAVLKGVSRQFLYK